MALIRRLARPMLSGVFIAGGLSQLKDPARLAPAAEQIATPLAEKTQLPNDPEMVVRINGAVMLIGGAMLATNKFPRVASVVLAASLIPSTYVGHPFWKEEDEEAAKMHQTQFLKNVGLLGGLILAAVDTEGKPGLAWRVANARQVAAREAKLAAAEAKLAVKR